MTDRTLCRIDHSWGCEWDSRPGGSALVSAGRPDRSKEAESCHLLSETLNNHFRCDRMTLTPSASGVCEVVVDELTQLHNHQSVPPVRLIPVRRQHQRYFSGAGKRTAVDRYSRLI